MTGFGPKPNGSAERKSQSLNEILDDLSAPVVVNIIPTANMCPIPNVLDKSGFRVSVDLTATVVAGS
jgi:hypothetical protein